MIAELALSKAVSSLITIDFSKTSPCGPIPHNHLARALMPRQPYSAAVQSDGEERLHPLPSEKGRGLERDVELPLAKGRRRDSKKIYFSFQKLFQSIFPFLYHSTITLAFSSQESSICLSLQFSERSFSKDISEVKTIDDA